MRNKPINKKTFKAILELRTGKVIRCKNFEDYKRKMGLKQS